MSNIGDVEKAFALVNKNIFALVDKIGSFGDQLSEEHIQSMYTLLLDNVRVSQEAALIAGKLARMKNGNMTMKQIVEAAKKAGAVGQSKVTYRTPESPVAVQSLISERITTSSGFPAVPEKRDYARIAGEGKRKPVTPSTDDDVDFVDE